MPAAVTNATPQLWSLAAIAVVAAMALARLFRPARGTTLLAVWMWAAAAIATLLAAETAIALGAFGAAGIAALRFAAAAATFCPIIAILGAKRPQDRAWQLIVFSFWIILALPAAQAWLRPGQMLVVHPIWSWFLVVLIVVGASNYLPTRYATASVLAAAGQAILVWRELPWVGGAATAGGSRFDWMPIVGLALLAVAAALTAIGWPQSRAAHIPLERLWRDFCDQFGVVWGLRVAERVNATAAQNHWDVRLNWHGITRADGSPLESPSSANPPSAEAENLKAALLPLLRRFVSAEWIDQRLEA